MERLQNKHGFGLMAVSLGYADTLMSLSAASTSSEMSEADKANAEISDGYVRMSIGITGTRCGMYQYTLLSNVQIKYAMKTRKSVKHWLGMLCQCCNNIT